MARLHHYTRFYRASYKNILSQKKAEFFLQIYIFVVSNEGVLWLRARINLIHPISHDNRLGILVDACNRAPLSSNVSSARTLPLCCRFFSNKEPFVQNLITSRCIVYVEFTTRSLCVAFCLYLRKVNENSSLLYTAHKTRM